jgi:DNA-binding CsgD family transcriptional regulator
MERLSIDQNDVRRLRELVALSADDDGVVLPWSFLHRLKELIGCDALAFNGLDSSAERHYFGQCVDRDDAQWGQVPVDPAEEDPSFWASYWSSTPCSYPDTSDDVVSVIKISDFYTVRQWHATAMYAECLGPEVEHEMMACLPDGAGRTLRLLCERGAGRDFGERERFLLQLLRPHIADAYRSAVRRRAEGRLTGRQRQILELVRAGMTNRQIARSTGLSEGTVRTHLNNIFTRLEVGSRTAAASVAG